MQKEIKIGGTTIPMRATAATAIRYRQVFGKDLIVELAREKAEAENLEIIQKLAFIMAKAAEGADMNTLSVRMYIDWLDERDYMDLVDALPDVIGLYMAGKGTLSDAKKKETPQSEK